MSSSEEALAKRSAWQGEDLASWTREVSSCLSSSVVLEKLSPDGSYGKTSPAFCHRTKGEPLAPSSGSWKTAGMLYRGECWTLSSSEYPSDAGVCFLSDILCQDAPQEYFLSPTACEGIIRRAERRGRSLPPTLKSALEAAIRSNSATPAPRAAGGSGPLIQDDLSATLATNQDQVLFQSTDVLPIDTTQVTDPRNGSNPQWGDPCHTMSAQGHTPAVCIGFSAGQSAQAGSIAAQEEIAPTLRATESGTNQVPSVAYAIAGNIIGREPENGGHHLGIEDDGACFTLTATDRHAVAFSWNAGVDIAAGEEITPTLRAAHSGGPVICMADDNAHAAIDKDCAGTIKAGGGSPIVASGYIVRRLMPVECERLQGFPDGWTDLGGTTDSARYKALGNSMAVPVILWLGQQIDTIENL